MQPKSIVCQFINSLATFRSAESTLAIRISNDPSLELLNPGIDIEGFDWLDGIDQNRSYDFVVVDLPLGMGRQKIEIGGSSISVRGNWVELSKALRILASDGVCVATVEPPAFGVSEGPEFQKALATEGFYLNGLFNTPPNLLRSTAIRPVIASFSRENRSSLFVAELQEEGQAVAIAEAFARGVTADSLYEGMSISSDEFDGFESLKARGR